MTSALSCQNSISLCPASFCTARPNLPVTPGVSWLPTFTFQSPIMKRTSFWGLVLKGLVGLHRTIQLQLLQCYWLGHRVGLPWHWMVCLENKQRSFCRFWDCIQVLHFGLFPSVQFSSLQSLSRVRLFATPWTAVRQASLSINNSWSLPKLTFIESVMPSSHLILSFPSPPTPNPSQHQGLFQWVSSSHQVAKVLEFQLQHQSFQWTPRTGLL